MIFSNKKIFFLVIIILSISLFFKIYDLKNPISTNGIDEGIHLLQAKMMSRGYNYYDDLKGDQAPLALLTFSIFKGDVMSCRYISVFLFFISSLLIFFIAKKLGGHKAAIIALIIFSLDFTIHRESRLASLDLFSASLLCASSFFFLRYLDNNNLFSLSFTSLFLSLSLMTKIIPIFLAIFLSLFLILKIKKTMHIFIYFFLLLLPILPLFYFFSFNQLMEGILFNQMHRGIDWYSKLSILLFICPSFIYLYSIKKWDIKDKKILYILSWLLLLLIPIMIQGRTSQHHFAYVAYPLSILTGYSLVDLRKSKKIAFASFISFNIFLLSFLSLTAPTDISYDVANEVKMITNDNDFVISGNPIVNVLSNRLAPPNITNLAIYHYPPTQPSDIIYWLKKNETKVIVLYYHLNDMKEVKHFLQNSSQWKFHKRIEGRGQILFDGFIPKFSEDVYTIYAKQ